VLNYTNWAARQPLEAQSQLVVFRPLAGQPERLQ